MTCEGLSQTLTAVYYKKGAYNFLKNDFLDRGGHKEHTEVAVLEIYEDTEDTASDETGLH